MNWLEDLHGFVFKKYQIPESTLTNVFLYGGLIGAIYNIFVYLSLLTLNNFNFRLVIFILLVLYFGYTFENIWNIFIIYYLFFLRFIKVR